MSFAVLRNIKVHNISEGILKNLLPDLVYTS